jgi:hypothetical protein
LRQLVRDKVANVETVLIVNDEQAKTPSRLADNLGPLKPYYTGESYEMKYLNGQDFDRHCSVLGLDVARKHPEIGIYGDQYVYQGIPDSAFPMGYFMRGKPDILAYRELFRRCWGEGTVV